MADRAVAFFDGNNWFHVQLAGREANTRASDRERRTADAR